MMNFSENLHLITLYHQNPSQKQQYESRLVSSLNYLNSFYIIIKIFIHPQSLDKGSLFPIMRQDQQNFSQNSLPQRRQTFSQAYTYTPMQTADDQNSQTNNFMTQTKFLKLKNLTNISDSIQNNADYQIEFLLRKISQLEAKVEVLQKKIKYRKKKRIRRTSEQIMKKFCCETCRKKYGTLVSLNLHLRLKHSFLNQQGQMDLPKFSIGQENGQGVDKQCQNA